MKEMYLDIMEKSLSPYTDQRIHDYIDEVRRDGLTEHGFPRLASNIGILIAYGRRMELLDIFVEIMDICCYAEIDGRKLIGAEKYAQHCLVKSESDADKAGAVFDVRLSPDITVAQKYTVSQSGVDISLSGCEQLGFMVPVFDFDGKDDTKITLTENEVAVEYQNAVCRYRFNGKCSPDFRYFYNRNGRYRVFEIAAKELHIEMESTNAL